MKTKLLLSCLLFYSIVFSQNQYKTWYFGGEYQAQNLPGAGLDFNNLVAGIPTPLTNSAMTFTEGSSCMSDANGKLMFYTDGNSVYNRCHIRMPNGFNLGSHWSTSYSALIVPNPSNDNQYYIFSVDGHPTSNGTGIFHSIVDMTLNNGLGDVLVAGKRTLLLSNTSELMQGAYHSNGTDFWVIIPDYPEDTNDVMKLYAYQVSGTGVSAPVITSLVGTGVDSFNPFVFKISPNNQKAILTALSFNERRSVLLDFNNLTGSFTFNTTFAIYNTFTSQGDDLRRGGFSPDGSIYYVEKSVVTTVSPFFGTRLFQYEMNGLNINSIPIQIGNSTNILDIKDGPDGKLYVNMDSANPTFLSRIENPNVLGVGCNFTLNSISLANRRISIALPLFLKPNHNYIIPTASIAITSNPNPATICLGQPIVFTANTNFVGTPQLQWQVNGINVLGQTGLIFTSSSLTNGDTVTCSLTDTCSVINSNSITVSTVIVPTFTQVQPICIGEALGNLPTTSNNGILGSWTPALNNNQTTTYTFTPNLGQCSSTATMTIQVNPLITPTFTQVQPICIGEALGNLPTTSNNGILGSWSPALNNIQTTTYTLTPNFGQCSSTATMTIEVNNNFNFSIKEYCNNSNLLLEVLDNDLFDLNNSFISWYVNNLYTNQTDKMFNLTNYLNSTSPVPVLPILVSAEVVNEDGCTKKVDYLIENLYCGIQKGISPNNDGSNEFFDLRLLSVKKLSIFNRYGVLAFEKENYYNEWVGQTNKGTELPEGTYYYLINFKNDQPAKTGWIYINR